MNALKKKIAGVLIALAAITGFGVVAAPSASAATLSRCQVTPVTWDFYGYTKVQSCYFDYTFWEEVAGNRDGTKYRYYSPQFGWTAWGQ